MTTGDVAQVDERTFFDLAEWMAIHDQLGVIFLVMRLKNETVRYVCRGGDHCVACAKLIEKWTGED